MTMSDVHVSGTPDPGAGGTGWRDGGSGRTNDPNGAHHRRKVYVEVRADLGGAAGRGPGPDQAVLRVPFTEVTLADSPGRGGPVPNDPIRLYDTSGPGSDPTQGLPPLRLPWITARGDVETTEGRQAVLRDDGRAAVRRAARD